MVSRVTIGWDLGNWLPSLRWAITTQEGMEVSTSRAIQYLVEAVNWELGLSLVSTCLLVIFISSGCRNLGVVQQ